MLGLQLINVSKKGPADSWDLFSHIIQDCFIGTSSNVQTFGK